ncbi:MAG: c-type cytochrome [Cyanobacterium sp. T60_A2020_053]|nr:c-type cytochrome [Cyanobacterium sp. T60_A2020_053]
MNNQLIETKLNQQERKTTVIALTIILIVSLVITVSFWLNYSPNPYVQEVLSYQGNLIRGEAIFNVNCAGCHGLQGIGNVGPNLSQVYKHKSEQGIINQVISGQTPPMPKFQPSAEDMADLLSYLKQL